MGVAVRENLQETLASACQLTVIRCSDFRHSIGESFSRLIRIEYGDHAVFDEIAVPGASYALAHDPKGVAGRLVMSYVEALIGLHDPERIVLVPHTECGWYASSGYVFSDEAHERNELISDARRAADVLHERFPRLTVDCLLAHVHGHDSPIERLERIDLNVVSASRRYPPAQIQP